MKNIGKQSILRTCECTYIGRQTILRTCECTYTGKQSILRTCECTYTGKQSILRTWDPGNTVPLENLHFWNFGTYPFSKSVYFLILNNFSKNGSPGQTTMLMRRAAKFCVEPRSPFSEISHHDSKTLGKPPSIVSWPECQCFLGSLGSYGI